MLPELSRQVLLAFLGERIALRIRNVVEIQLQCRFGIVNTQDEVFRNAHGARHRLPGRQAQGLATLQVALCERLGWRVNHRLWQIAETEGELGVNVARLLPLGIGLLKLKETVPLDNALW